MNLTETIGRVTLARLDVGPLPVLDFAEAEHDARYMSDATLATERQKAIGARDLFDYEARATERRYSDALAAFRDAITELDAADLANILTRATYGEAADRCCVLASEANRRIELAHEVLAALAAK